MEEPKRNYTWIVLAIVLVGADDSVEGPYFVRSPFDAEPGWGVSSVNYQLKALLARADRI